MNDSSLKTRILRQLPGLSGYYDMIDRLNEERINALRALEPYKGGPDAATARSLEAERNALREDNDRMAEECAILRAETANIAGERDTARTLVQALEQERSVMGLDLSRIAEDRNAALALAESREKECTTLRLDLSRIAEERDALQLAQKENAILLEQYSSRLPLEEAINLLVQRVAGYEEVTLRAINNVSAGTVGLAARQEEAIARLGRSLRSGEAGGGIGRAIDLYLDLLEASLTGFLGEDGEKAPWASTDDFNPAVRAIGRDWPKHALTMIGTARMRNLRMLLRQALDDNIPGDFIETGVWRGGACIYAKGIFEACGVSNRKIFVADSFRGLPKPNAERYPADSGDQHHTFEELAISRAVVTDNFRRYGLLDDNVVFLEGWFKDTLPTAPIERLAVLRLDGDMYESTIDTLNALYHKVSPGGFVIVDDYLLRACAQAIDEFRAEHNISAPLQPIDDAAVWWRV